MSSSRLSLWFYPLFQIPLMCMAGCLVAAALFWLLGLGRPPVAVAIAIDLSSSTYGASFNYPGSVMYQEVEAVKAYLNQNSQQLQIGNQNQIQVFGFGGLVVPLTNGFKTDSERVETELTQVLQSPDLPQRVASSTTNINLAIQKTTEALSRTQNYCRELLLVTDGEASVSPPIIAEAKKKRVRINVAIVGAEAPQLKAAATTTKGIYVSGDVNNLEAFFTNQFFNRFNSNIKWIIFWLSGAWIALMWLLTLPLDRWVFQGFFKLEMPLAGQLSLGNAFFWSALTPILVWQFLRAINLPFFSAC